MVSYPAHGWLPPGAHFDWQHADQGRDFVTNWQGVIQAPGDGVCVATFSDGAFPNGFGPSYPIVQITTGPFSKGGAPGQPAGFNGEWYIGHCTSLVKPGQRFTFGAPLARADQGHNFSGTTGGWVELGMRLADGTLGPMSAAGHWYDAILKQPLTKGPMLKGADHSTGGAAIGAELKAAGLTRIVRYASQGRGDVNITPSEVADLKAHGIEVGIFVEHSARWLLSPPSVVAGAFVASRAITRTCGLPDGPSYGAGDFDATNVGPTFPGSPGDQQMHQILSGLTAAAAQVGHDNIGFYGSYFAIDWLVHHAPWIKWYCQTVSWSQGLEHPQANIFQHADQSVTVGGVQCDPDDFLTAAWGQRDTQQPQPQPQPQPPKREEIVSIAATTNVDGRVELFVEAQDGSIWHTYQEFAPGTKNITGWAGGVPNVTAAKLSPLAPAPK